MSRSSEVDIRAFAFQCAWLWSLGVEVDKIAETTGKSKPTVYRALHEARALGWLDDRPRLTMSPGPARDAFEEYVLDIPQAQTIKALFGSREQPQHVVVVPAPRETDEDRLDFAISRFLRSSPLHQELLDADIDLSCHESECGLLCSYQTSARAR
ncbi:MAG: hypothetical protein ACUVX8_04150 [Candidatus Zipacnadales bacterium]